MEFLAAVPTRDHQQSAVGRSGAEGLAALSAGLARALADTNANSNLVFSPLSIYTALAVLAVGARGTSLEEILHVLGVRSRSELDEFVALAVRDAMHDRSGSGGPRIAFACGVWSDLSCPLKPGFREAVVDGAYGAEASTVDFGNPKEACQLINSWAARATNHLIHSVLGEDSVTRDTRVVLGNAVYFKGKWDQPFNKRATKNALFRRLGGAGPVDVPFMQSWKPRFIAVHDGFKVLKLGYKMLDPFLTRDGTKPAPFFPHRAPLVNRHDSNRSPSTVSLNNNVGSNNSQHSPSKSTQFSMCIFLPDADDGLRSLVEQIASSPSFLHQHLPRRKVDILKKLGLQLPFSPAADLSDMTEEGQLHVNQVIHKAIIEVNEEGTEAAAVTMFSMDMTAPHGRPPPPPRVDFVADHPFAYFIVEEETGAVVFAGHILDPSRQ